MLGRHLVERLQQDGWHVRALVRDAARAGVLSRSGVELATGDMLDATSLQLAARGVDAVFHAAAVITPRGGWEEYRRVNVEGTANMIAACATSGARLLHVSSVAVYGAQARYQARGSTSEETPYAPMPDGAWYARSKRESETLVMEAHAAGRVWATAIRPDVIYGRYDRQFVPRMARLFRHGVAPVIAGGLTTLAIVHAANVTDGAVRALESDAAGGRAYNLANDGHVTVRRFVELAGEGLGVTIRTPSVPRFLARGAFELFRSVAPLVMGAQLNAASDASFDFISRDNPFTSQRAMNELGWVPPVEPETGIADAFSWWAAHH